MGPFVDQSSASWQGRIASRSANNASGLSRRLNYTGSQMGESQPVLRETAHIPGAPRTESKNFHNHMSSIQNFEHDKESSPQHRHISIQNQNAAYRPPSRGPSLQVHKREQPYR